MGESVAVKEELLREVSVDHVVIVVRDLATAIDDFTNLGFTVTPGGRHEGGLTHNALIVLEDGTYIELFAPTRPWIMTLLASIKRLGLLGRLTCNKSSIVRRFLEHVAGGEGFADFALLTTRLEQQLAAAREQALPMDKPLPGGRTRPDGQQINWRFGVPLSTGLPFLIEDLTPRPLRVPEGSSRQHANGVCGIVGITVEVLDLPQSAAYYQALLCPGHGTCARVVTAPNHALDFHIGAAAVTLVARTDGNSATARSTRAGLHRLALKLRTASKVASGVLDPQRTHNAGIELISS